MKHVDGVVGTPCTSEVGESVKFHSVEDFFINRKSVVSERHIAVYLTVLRTWMRALLVKFQVV